MTADTAVDDPLADEVERAPGDHDDQGSARRTITPRQLWHAARLPLALLFLLFIVVQLLLIIGAPPHAGRLDPEATGRGGSRAVAQLLRDRGVDVRRSTTVPDGATGTLLVARADLLQPADLTRLVADSPARHVVLVAANGLTALGSELTTGEAQPVRVRPPACDLPAAVTAGAAHIGGEVYAADGGTAQTCYAAAGRPSLVQVTAGGRTVTLLGSGDLLTNERLDEEGNAALALGLLTGQPTVDWVVQSPATVETTDEDEDLNELLPDWVGWLQLQLLVAGLIAALWRGRRLGPIVHERLPVVVRAAEAVEGRARLYAAGRARDRAADSLRTGARSRLGRALSLAPDASPDQTVDAVSARSRRDPAVVASLLYGPAPSDDESLVRLASELDSLDSEVRRT